MSKADKMFKKLGYELFVDKNDFKIYRHCEVNLDISFELNFKQFLKLWNDRMSPITVDEHLAIHEKMKELGWLDA